MSARERSPPTKENLALSRPAFQACHGILSLSTAEKSAPGKTVEMTRVRLAFDKWWPLVKTVHRAEIVRRTPRLRVIYGHRFKKSPIEQELWPGDFPLAVASRSAPLAAAVRILRQSFYPSVNRVLPSRSGSSWFSLFYFHKVQSWRLLKELRPEPPVESPYVYGRSTAQVKGAFPNGAARCLGARGLAATIASFAIVPVPRFC